MALDIIFSAAVSIGLFVLIALRLAGVVPDVVKVLRPAAFFVLLGGWLVELAKWIQLPAARTDLGHWWALAANTVVVVSWAYAEIKTRLRPRTVTIN
jgi:p-aminobenzoyl-glutamate transporter AbgT